MIELYLNGYGEIADDLAGDLGCRADELTIKLEWEKGSIRLRNEKSGHYLSLNMDLVKKGAAALLRKKA